MGAISFYRCHQRIDNEEERRLVRVYESPDSPATVVVPEAQAERILSSETDLLTPEDVFAALRSVPEPHTLKSVVLLDERDEYARTAPHPKWPAAHKSFGGGGEVCFHGVSTRDDAVAILNYHWAIEALKSQDIQVAQFIPLKNPHCSVLYELATRIELDLYSLSCEDLEVDWGAQMAGDILARQTEAFEAFAAQAPLRTVALSRGLQALVSGEGSPPLSDALIRRVDYAETTVRATARRQLVDIAMREIAWEEVSHWRLDYALNLLLAYGEEEDFQSLTGVTTLRIETRVAPPKNPALLNELISLGECDLSHHQNDLEPWLRQLSRCPKLKTLWLHGSRLMSSALVVLPLFQSLTELDLADTAIFDAAVFYLTMAKRLQWLNISRTQITDDGIASLKRALPGCEIITGS